MVSWYSDSEIAYSIHGQTTWSTIYLDVDLCVTEEAKKCLFTVFVFIQDIVMSVSKTDHWDEPVLQKCTVPENITFNYINKQIIWHSARKHEISASLLLFDINSCSFVHSGLNEVWRFGMLMLWYDVASTWRLVYAINQWYIRYLFDIAFDQRSYGIRHYAEYPLLVSLTPRPTATLFSQEVSHPGTDQLNPA